MDSPWDLLGLGIRIFWGWVRDPWGSACRDVPGPDFLRCDVKPTALDRAGFIALCCQLEICDVLMTPYQDM